MAENVGYLPLHEYIDAAYHGIAHVIVRDKVLSETSRTPEQAMALLNAVISTHWNRPPSHWGSDLAELPLDPYQRLRELQVKLIRAFNDFYEELYRRDLVLSTEPDHTTLQAAGLFTINGINQLILNAGLSLQLIAERLFGQHLETPPSPLLDRSMPTKVLNTADLDAFEITAAALLQGYAIQLVTAAQDCELSDRSLDRLIVDIEKFGAKTCKDNWVTVTTENANFPPAPSDPFWGKPHGKGPSLG